MELSEFKQKFVEDSSLLLNSLEADLMALEKEPENNELIENIFRVMHTLKGVSSMYGYENIGELTHKIENIYELIRDKKLKVNKEILDLTLVSCDHIKQLLDDPNFSVQQNIDNHEKIESKIIKILSKSGVKTHLKKIKSRNVTGGKSTFNILFYPRESILKRNINLIEQFRELFILGEHKIINPRFNEFEENWSIFLVTEKNMEDIEDALFFILDECKILKIADFDIFNETEFVKKTKEINSLSFKQYEDDEDLIETFAEKKSEIDKIKITKQNTGRISVDTDKLDKLMYLVSELITTNSQLNLLSKQNAHSELKEYLDKINTLSNEFRNNALELRLVPISDMALRFQRLVRDLSTHLGKQIEFVTQGTNTELDKNTIDLLQEPLMHIIRNCIDHGIQMPEERKTLGKDTNGIIKLVAFHSGNNVFIQIQDDGKGINHEEILEKAIQKGFVDKDRTLSEKEVLDLIFLPGFSTAQNLTEVSGSGVGLDVVKRNITELRGEIIVQSELGLGTIFTIKLQQSLAIMDTMLFSINETFFLIPLENVEVITVHNPKYILERERAKTIAYNNNLIPFLDLRKTFIKDNNYPEKLETIIITKNEKLLAIVADKIIGEHQAVLKNIGKEYKELEFLSGASILADGNIALMLDPGMLFDRIKSE